MFWIVVAAVLLVGLALAWWSSGRARPVLWRRPPVDSYTLQAQEQAGLRSNYGGGNGLM